MVMKEGGQKVIENEEEDDFGRPMGHPFVARTKNNQRLSEAALTLSLPSSPRHPGGLVSRQVFLITRRIRCWWDESHRAVFPEEEKREKF